MKKILTIIIILLSFIHISLYSAKSKKIELTIFFTNDTNGHPIKFTYMDKENQGGIPARKTLINKILAEKTKPEYLILDAGGIVLGRPESNLFNGLPDIEGMNSIGYHAAGVGISELHKSVDYFNTLNNNADFYFLCANVQNIENETICDKYLIKKIGGFDGVNIGIFSLITNEAKGELSKTARDQFIFLDPIKTAEEIVLELKNKKNKTDIIIALTQLGYYEDDTIIGSRTLASSINGIDIIIDGRTGKKLSNPVVINKTRICQAFKWGFFLGEINLVIEDKKITDFKYTLHPVNYTVFGDYTGAPLEDDKKTLTRITNKMKNYEKIQQQPIVTVTEGSFNPKYIRYKDTELGNLICDAIIDYTDADIAFQNAGGIGDVTVEAGSLNRQSLDKAIIYDNSIVLLNMTGDEIFTVLEQSMNKMGYGAFLQVGGIKFDYSKSEKKISNVTVDGRTLIKSNFYKVAINSWLAEGGDDYTIFKEMPNKVNLNILHREVVYDYLEKQSEFKAATDNRINIID